MRSSSSGRKLTSYKGFNSSNYLSKNDIFLFPVQIQSLHFQKKTRTVIWICWNFHLNKDTKKLKGQTIFHLNIFHVGEIKGSKGLIILPERSAKIFFQPYFMCKLLCNERTCAAAWFWRGKNGIDDQGSENCTLLLWWGRVLKFGA